mmetsp:Transcript_41618/g.97819  ORF Transcript_41618/g.97819 Transcript_41618/m.97819 type:complete len:221 (-) Transcript_41618:818-1480(-)
MSFFQSMDAGVTSSTSHATKLPICSRYSPLALSRVTQKDLLIDGGTTTVRTAPNRFSTTASASTWPAASRPTAAPSVRLRRRSSLRSPLSRSKSMVGAPRLSADHAADVRGRGRAHRGQRAGRQVPVEPVDREGRVLVGLDAGDPARGEQPGGEAQRERELRARHVAHEQAQQGRRRDVDVPEADLPLVVEAPRDVGVGVHGASRRCVQQMPRRLRQPRP